MTREGELFYRIENFDDMDDFFISVVSDSNHWLFISTHGGLSAGRTDCDSACSPTTPKTRFATTQTIPAVEPLSRWNRRIGYVLGPFSTSNPGIYAIQRNLYKNVLGDKLVFEETNQDLGIRFSYSWETSDQCLSEQPVLRILANSPCRQTSLMALRTPALRGARRHPKRAELSGRCLQK